MYFFSFKFEIYALIMNLYTNIFYKDEIIIINKSRKSQFFDKFNVKISLYIYMNFYYLTES